MVFNWFRRQFSDNKDKTEANPVETAEVQPPAQPSVESEQSSSETPEVSEDYLAWAKAAYKNIQSKQQTEESPEATESVAESVVETQTVSLSSESETAATIEIETPATVENELAAEISESPAITEELVTPSAVEMAASAEIENTTTEIVSEVAENLEALANSAIAQAIPVETVQAEQPTVAAAPAEEVQTAPTSGAVPFWARDDRQARLERLKATAIEEEPEPQAQVQPASTVAESPTTEEIAGLAFDEGFIWSAEILAAQGRRAEDVSIEEITWLKKLRQGLDKTRRNIVNQLKAIVGQGPLNQDAVMEIEALLLQADVGVEATDYIIKSLQSKLKEEALPPDAAIAYLKKILRDMLEAPLQKSYKASFAPEKETFNIWLMTGVNGAGKTTTIGKLAHLADKSGYKCLIAAADTFRAAAVEQVKIWGQRSGVEVIANPGQNTDPAAVVFDAITSAKARNTELLLIDTAGRLQNKKNLMEELTKIRRIIDKKAPDAIVESLLVLDATLGQNGLRQAQVFSEAAKLSGVVLTKLDGTAKGGVALAVVQQLGLPIRFIGAGEGIEDLRPFSSYEFVEALLSG